MFSQAPVLGCFLVCLPFALAIVFCYLCSKARPAATDEDEDGVALFAPSAQRRGKASDKKSD